MRVTSHKREMVSVSAKFTSQDIWAFKALLPNWERWYPSLFDAADDLGIIRAEVCDPDSLNLNRRHAKVRQRANDAHLEKWGGKPQE